MLNRFCVVVIFGVAFAYIEAAVVVYLRRIFHPDGFSFPLHDFGVSPLWKRLLLTEVGREGATLVIIFTSSWLFGQSLHQRFAYFLTIFAIWDIFYYIWLKLLIDWPSSVMDWDILFLMPTVWAGPVLAPVLISFTLLVFAIVILYRYSCGMPIRVTLMDWFGFILSGLVVVASFCIAGRHIRKGDFKSYFYWLLFAAGNILAVVVFLKCYLKSG
jgi:hypothetical protein